MKETQQLSPFRTSSEPSTRTRTNGNTEQLALQEREPTNGAAAVNTTDLGEFSHLLPMDQIHLCHPGLNGRQP